MKEQKNMTAPAGNQPVVTNQTVESILNSLDSKQPGTATITLNDLEKQSGLSRAEVIQALRKFPRGTYIQGRRGHLSRWTNKPQAEKRSNPGSFRRQTGAVSGDYTLQVTAAGQVFRLPIDKLEVVR